MLTTHGASYHRGQRTGAAKSQRALSFSAGLLAFFFLLAALLSGFGGSVAYAKDDDATIFNNAASDYGVKEGDGASFETVVTKAEKDGSADRNSFSYVVNRFVGLNYINSTPSVKGLGLSIGEPKFGTKNCSATDPRNATLVGHNCDVPNLLTEFMQDKLANLVSFGPVEATVTDATTSVGVPGGIPNNVVPLDEDNRPIKYTALELFGYNLKYTQYQGEWDHIKVMTTARALQNFGTMDSLKLGWRTVQNGVAGTANEAIKGAVEGWSKGGLIKATTGFFRGAWEGGATGTLNAILDASDLNVFNSNAWYRVGFGPTLYGARELSQEELQLEITKNFWRALSGGGTPVKADVPQDFKAIEAGPKAPQGAIASCQAKNSATGKMEEVQSKPYKSPGVVSLEACKTLASNLGNYDVTTAVWKVDGLAKAETATTWLKNNDAIMAKGVALGIDCDFDPQTKDADLATAVDAYRSCWTIKWEDKAGDAAQQAQQANTKNWVNLVTSPPEMFAVLGHNNFNSPWNRYVCVDAQGKDVKDGVGKDASLAFLVKEDGSLNTHEGCPSTVRPTVQGGLFGDGYVGDKPALDTRRTAMGTSNDLISYLNPFSHLFNVSSLLTNAGLDISKNVTKFMVSIVDASYAPLLDKFHLKPLIMDVIKALRDSIYLPFLALAGSVGALMVLFNAGSRKQYTEGLKELLTMLLVIFFGAMLLFRPDLAIKAVDEIPSEVETIIVGAVASVGGQDDDNLCSTTTDGTESGFDAKASARMMECQIWKVFVFEPWVQGQWGTSYSNLYTYDSAHPGHMHNSESNATLVGDASVVMGGGVTEHNWALYQTKILSRGTITSKAGAGAGEAATAAKTTPADFYRLVDLQAGPNNGEGTDSTYFANWSKASGHRFAVAFLSPLLAMGGAWVIFTFTVAKITFSLLMTLMLLGLPLALLAGVPKSGRGYMKKYFGTLLGLALQRIMLVTLLAVMFKILSSMADAADNYLLSFILMLATLLAFYFYRRPLLKLAGVDATKGLGVFGSNIISRPEVVLSRVTPKSFRNQGSIWKAQGRGAFAGGIAGFMSGGVTGAMAGAHENAVREGNKANRRQMGRGMGDMLSNNRAWSLGKQVARGEVEAVTREQTNDLNRMLHEKSASLAKDQAAKLAKDHGLEEESGEAKALSALMQQDAHKRVKAGDLVKSKNPKVKELAKLNEAIYRLENAPEVSHGVKLSGKQLSSMTPEDRQAAFDKQRERARKAASLYEARQQELTRLRQEKARVEEEIFAAEQDLIDYDEYVAIRNRQVASRSEEFFAAIKKAEEDDKPLLARELRRKHVRFLEDTVELDRLDPADRVLYNVKMLKESREKRYEDGREKTVAVLNETRGKMGEVAASVKTSTAEFANELTPEFIRKERDALRQDRWADAMSLEEARRDKLPKRIVKRFHEDNEGEDD